MSFSEIIKEDRKANSQSVKGRFIVFWFRIASICYIKRKNPLYFLGIFIRIFYKFFIMWGMGVDLEEKTVIGKGLCVFHGQGLVMNNQTIVGDYVTLRHNTTIGNARIGGGCPVIGNHVEVGANCVVIGDIKIGDNSIIAAGAIVIKDVPPNCIVAGNPARVVKLLDNPAPAVA
jgi:serine acetyltransferase